MLAGNENRGKLLFFFHADTGFRKLVNGSLGLVSHDGSDGVEFDWAILMGVDNVSQSLDAARHLWPALINFSI